MPAKKPASRRVTPKRTPDDVRDEFLENVAVGNYDLDIGGLNSLLGDVMGQRAKKLGKVQRFSIALGDITVREEELTLNALDIIRARTGLLWFQLDGNIILADHFVLRSVIEAVLITRDDWTADEAAAKVGAFTADEASTCVTIEVIDADPQ